MRKISIILFILIGSMLQIGEAYFKYTGKGVRPTGLGSAYVAVSDDTNAILYNPSGLAQINHIEMIGMYAALFTGVEFSTFYGKQAGPGYHFVGATIPLTKKYHHTLAIAWQLLDDDIYQENIFRFSYAMQLIEKYNINIGTSIKIEKWSMDATFFTQDSNLYPNRSVLFPTLSKSGLTADLGLLVEPYKQLMIGATVENIIPLRVNLWDEVPVPLTFRIGASYKLHLQDYLTWPNDVLDHILFSGEYNYRDSSQNINVGIEAWFLKELFAIRGGINIDEMALGCSWRSMWPNWPFNFQLDYAFTYPFQISQNIGSHRLGITIKEKRQSAIKPLPAVMEEADDRLNEVVNLITSTPTPQPTAETLQLVTQMPEVMPLVQKVYQVDPVPNEEGKVIIGYIKNNLYQFSTAQETLKIMEQMKQKFETQLKFEIVLVGFTDFEQAYQFMRNNEIDILLTSNRNGVFISEDQYVKAIGVLTKNNRNYQFLSFYVFRKSEVKKLTHLDKKNIGLINWNKKEEVIQYIKAQRSRLEGRFIKYNNGPAALLGLYMNQIDALVGPENYIDTINHNLSKNQLLKSELVLLEKTSVQIKNSPILMRRNVMPAKKNKINLIIKEIKSLFSKEEAEVIIKFFGFNGIRVFDK